MLGLLKMETIRQRLQMMNLSKNVRATTNGIVHAGFSGLQMFVARKKNRCKLIGFRLEIPPDHIQVTVGNNRLDYENNNDNLCLHYLFNFVLFARRKNDVKEEK